MTWRDRVQIALRLNEPDDAPPTLRHLGRVTLYRVQILTLVAAISAVLLAVLQIVESA